MLILIPVLRTDHGRLQITGRQTVNSEAVGFLAADTRINELVLEGGLPTPEVLKQLVSFSKSSLKSLVLKGDNISPPLSLEPLCAGNGPPQLKTLTLINIINVTGLDLCLAHHPLQELHLLDVTFPPSQALSTRLASSTLKLMHLDLNLSFPVFTIANLPALHTITIRYLDLRQLPGHDMSAESVRWVQRLASGIASFPCVHIVGAHQQFASNPWI